MKIEMSVEATTTTTVTVVPVLEVLGLTDTA